MARQKTKKLLPTFAHFITKKDGKTIEIDPRAFKGVGLLLQTITKKWLLHLKKGIAQQLLGLYQDKWYWIVILCITIASLVLRLWGLKSNLHFAGDEAHHLEVITNIYKDHTFVLQGPSASSGGGLYHGAYFYYLSLIPAMLSHSDPLAVDIAATVLNVCAIPLLAYAVAVWCGKKASILAIILYSLSFVALIYSRWNWNPNTIPFFAVLSLFALSKMTNGKPWYLVLFSFAVSSITQLHIAAFVFIPIYVITIIFLPKNTRNLYIWLASVAAWIVPWIPTILHEATHHFELVKNILELLRQPSKKTMLDHLNQGVRFSQAMFEQTLQLPAVWFWITISGAAATLMYQIYTFRKTTKMLMPLYILLIMLFSFVSYCVYPDVLFPHVAEQLFVLYPILLMLILVPLLDHIYSVVVVIAIVVAVGQANWNLYDAKIVHGTPEYAIYQKICNALAETKNPEVELIYNGQKNPNYIGYICREQYNVRLGTGPVYTINVSMDPRATYIARPL